MASKKKEEAQAQGLKTVQELNPGREPGVYVGLSMEEYHADTALGSSGIKKLITEGPEAYWFDSPLNPSRPQEEKTIAQKFGTAYHTLMLEPEKFDYKIKPKVNSTKEEGMLGEGEYADLMAMREALTHNPRHAASLQGGLPEVSIFWRDHETGIMCKVRYDYFAPEWVVDLKKCRSINNKRLRYDIPDYGYDVSGSMYSIAASVLKDMLRAGYQLPPEFAPDFGERFLARENQLFAFLMQQDYAPYTARMLLLTPDVSAVGRDKFRRGLEVYQDHQYTLERWPSGYEDVEDMTMDMLSDSINYF